MRRIVLGAVAGGLAVIAVGTLAAYYVEKPSMVRIAVARDTEDFRLITAAQQVLRGDHQNVRFRVVPVDTAAQSAAALEGGSVDFAVVRSDIDMPKSGQTALIFHRNSAVILAPAKSAIHSSTDLNAHRIGVVSARPGASANLRLLDSILARYEAEADNTLKIPLQPGEVESALTEGRVDAVMVVGPPQSATVAQVVTAVATAGGGPPVFVPIAEAKAIAQTSAAIETAEIPRGAFGGPIPRPERDVETVSVSTRLVARSTVSDSLVGNVTRHILENRLSIAASVPLANLIEAPSTDRDARLPVHPGAAAYIDGEEETFLDKYSDFFYIGAMVLSVFASAAAALASRVTAPSPTTVEDLLGRLIEVLAGARRADSLQELDTLESEADRILIEALQAGSLRALEAHRATAFSMALDQVRHAIRDRRYQLTNVWGRAAYDPPRIAAGE